MKYTIFPVLFATWFEFQYWTAFKSHWIVFYLCWPTLMFDIFLEVKILFPYCFQYLKIHNDNLRIFLFILMKNTLRMCMYRIQMLEQKMDSCIHGQLQIFVNLQCKSRCSIDCNGFPPWFFSPHILCTKHKQHKNGRTNTISFAIIYTRIYCLSIRARSVSLAKSKNQKSVAEVNVPCKIHVFHGI